MVDRWVNEIEEQEARNSPRDAAHQGNIAVIIDFCVVGVIPPTSVKYAFQGDAGD